MALIGNNPDSLLHGLSDFWHRFFRDIGDIQVTYEGTEILLGQVYLNFMSDVLNTNIVETPLFRKEYYKLITVREDQIIFHERGDGIPLLPPPTFYGNPGTDRYVRTLDTFFGSIPQLQDVVYSPKAALTEGIDYKVAGAELQFKADPTAPFLPGYAQRRVVIGIGGQFTSATVSSWDALGVKKGDKLYFSEKIDVGAPATINDAWFVQYADARVATIVHIKDDVLSVSAETPLPTFPVGAEPGGFSWRIIRQRDDGAYNQTLPDSPAPPSPVSFVDGQIKRITVGGKLENIPTLEVVEVSFWAVDSKVDDLAIYNTYGYFFTNKQLSTETYRSLIRGLMQLYILGPAMARLESALNLTASLPTVRTEGEILLNYDSGILSTGTGATIDALNVLTVPTAVFSASSVGGYVKITESDYANNIGTFNIIAYVSTTQVKLKPTSVFTVDPLDSLTWTYTKNNRQYVTTDQNVYEYPLNTPMRPDVKNPANYGILTFQAFEVLTTAIQVTDYVQDPEWWHTITIPQEIMPDTPAARRSVSPQLYPNILGPSGHAYVGDPGFYIGQDEDEHVTNPGFRHSAAFILMDRFLKMHMFGVLVDQSVSLTGLLVTDLQKILRDVKPVHTALYFRPVTSFRDIIDLTDELTVRMVRRQLETMGLITNDLTIGSPWLIGDSWVFTNPAGGALTINPGAGGMFAAIGGLDPSIQPADPTNVPPVSAPEFNLMDRPLYVYMHA